MKRRTEREQFFQHAIRHQARRHPSTMTAAEMDAMTSSVLIEHGMRRCRCGRWWQDATVDIEARDLDVVIVHAAEAAPAVLLLRQGCEARPTIRPPLGTVAGIRRDPDRSTG